MKTRTITIGQVLPPTKRYFNTPSLPPIKYLSSDHIKTRSIRELCSFMRAFTSRFQIWYRPNIRWGSIENLRYWREIWPHFAAILLILFISQIWTRKVRECIKLRNLLIDHVMIQSELKYLIGAKGVKTVYLELLSSSNAAKNLQFSVWSGYQTHQDKVYRVSGQVWNQPEPNCCPKTTQLAGYLDPLVTLKASGLNTQIPPLPATLYNPGWVDDCQE